MGKEILLDEKIFFVRATGNHLRKFINEDDLGDAVVFALGNCVPSSINSP